jgi:replicative DNA helicase
MPRQLPHNVEAEQSILGSMLISKDVCIEVFSSLTKDDYYIESHREIYNAMISINQQGRPIDITTLTSYLKDMHALDKAGGVEYFLQLSESVPTTAHTKYYLDIILDKSILRRLIKNATSVIEGAHSEIENVGDFISDSEKLLLSITRDRNSGEFKDIDTVVRNITAQMEMLQQNKGRLSGVATKFRDLDRLTNGFQKGDLIILGARPSVGKTAFALNLAQNVAHKSSESVAFFSLEMPAEQLIRRTIAAMGGIDSTLLRNGDILTNDPNKYYAACERVLECNLYIDDTPGIKINDLISKCRRLKQEKGLSLIVIDYLQLIVASGSSRNDNRQQEVSDISRQLKALARELECPLIALSQLSRNLERREDKRPMMSDLRESGAIEQDADLIMFLYREGYQKNDASNSGIVELNLAKHRNGSTGQVSLAIELNYSRFSNLAHEQNSNLPMKDLRT